MLIRTYQSSDLDRCRELWTELTQHHRDIYDSQKIGGDNPGLAFDEHLEEAGPERIFLGVVDDKIIGLIGLLQDEKQGEVEPIVISPQYRGTGYGKQLLQHVIKVAEEAGIWRLSIRPVARNIDAIRLFHDQGFDALGRIELVMSIKGGKHLVDGPELFNHAFKF
ncbi:MAG: GNAT family N-acetyltransferase [Chromatiales bacterium]|nr:GNAT family N-acetyltransferase [Chromatiales bacterium]